MAAIVPFLDRTKRTEDTGTPDAQCPVGSPPGGPLPTLAGLLGEAQETSGDVGDLDLVEGIGPPKFDEAPRAMGDFGVVRDVPELKSSHAELTRTAWIRRAIEEALLTGGKDGGPRDFWVESDCKTGELFFHLHPAMEKDILPWYVGVHDTPRFSLFGSNGKMKCVAGGTLVPVSKRGLVAIENVLVGEEVLTRNGWRKVTAAQQTGIRATLEIVAESGQRVRVTPDHLIAAKAGWPKGHKPHPRKRGELGWARADELEPGMFVLPAPEGFAAASAEAAGTEGDYEIGTLIGYVVGDGTFAANGRIAIDVGQTKYTDLDVIADIARRHFGAAPHWGEYAATRGENPKFVTKTMVRRIYWEDEKLTSFFATLGLKNGVKSPLRRVPKSMFNSPRRAILGFLSGLFSTDGSIGRDAQAKVRAELDTTSEGLALDVQRLFLALGARVSISKHAPRMVGKHSVHRVNVRSARALDALASANLVNELKRKTLGLCTDLPRNEKGVRLTRVERVNDDRLVVPVFDLTVEDDHEFVAGGLVVHNCPTWDLPAGSPVIGGSCPGATAGQTVVEPEKRRGQLVDGQLPSVPGLNIIQPVDERRSICQQCYALEGNYPSPHVQVGEILRYWWTRSMIAEGQAEEWIETMVKAIGALNIPRTRQGIRPIRVHSAGDFFSPAYAEAWMEVANRVWDLEVSYGRSTPEIRFWAPTRTWAAKGFDWERIADRLAQPNMLVRPSAYHVDDHAPGALAQDWPMGATSIINDHNRGMIPELAQVVTGEATQIEQLRAEQRAHAGLGPDDRYNWQCMTYAIALKGAADLAPSCEDAIAPDGKRGCRACWTHPQLRVNYTTH